MDASGEEHTALLTYDDIAEWNATVEEPVSFNYLGLDVHKCPSWTQGPVFLQQLALLEGFDLKRMGHNSADYLHTLVEASKLEARRGLIGDTASMELRPGDVGGGIPEYANMDVPADSRRALGLGARAISDERVGTGGPASEGSSAAHLGDTTHLDAVDREGNMVASTPSGGWLGTSPIIKGLGFPIGPRGQMFYLNPARPTALAPRKRPRATLTPSLVTRDGQPFMVFGTPGGDSQDQWTVQFFLNYADFGMNIQEALDAPTVHSVHFPSSFYPRGAYPGRM